MKCPNCGTTYTEHETICPTCGQPLSNANYTPVISHSVKRKKKATILLFLLLFLLLIAGGGIGSYIYLNQVEKKCTEAVDQIFSMAHNMDFSSADPSYLPEPLQKNPDIRSWIENNIYQSLDSYYLDTLLTNNGIEIDMDKICDEILLSANYSITDVQTSFSRCTVTVQTKNTDFSGLPEAIAKEIEENHAENNSFWQHLQDFFSSIFSSPKDNKEETEPHENHWDTKSESQEEDSSLSSIYEEFKKSAPQTTESGTFTFGISNGHWTLLSMDKDLFLSYYGFPDLDWESLQ